MRVRGHSFVLRSNSACALISNWMGPHLSSLLYLTTIVFTTGSLHAAERVWRCGSTRQQVQGFGNGYVESRSCGFCSGDSPRADAPRGMNDSHTQACEEELKALLSFTVHSIYLLPFI